MEIMEKLLADADLHPAAVGSDTREVLESPGYTPVQIEDLLQQTAALEPEQ